MVEKKFEDKKSKSMTTKDIKNMTERIKEGLVSLTGFKFPSVIGVKNEGNNEWLVTVELVEKESIPSGMDILGTYEVRANQDGDILDYKRTDLRKRIDTVIDPKV